ncbi:substrate-binding domain-containing protein [Flaviflexus huanghaiensis]|uniref:substrate-binding domain-containing protein n=1 Tax=Flaviflexus huanghaiensis TaxID=1111473 RepID=UPI0015F9B827
MKKVGIREVAKHAGVSIGAVSRILNNRDADKFPEATRDRVHVAAHELGYRPNMLARGLRTSRTHTVGLVTDMIATTPYASGIAAAAQEVAQENGVLLFLVNTGGSGTIETNAVDALLAQQVDGFIFATMSYREVDVPERLPTDTVLVNCVPRSGHYRVVVPDDYGGAHTAMRYLVEAGHRRIAFVDTDEKDPDPLASQLRFAGYRDVLHEAGIPFDENLVVEGRSDSFGGRAAVDRLLTLPAQTRPTAVFCFNDRMAAGAYIAARRHGMQVPADLSIVGYDDQALIAAEIDPGLTTVALPHHAMGRLAMKMLLGIDEPHEESLMKLECPLIVRESVRPLTQP